MARRKTELLTVREFRKRLPHLTEPVKVIRARGKVEIIGTWTPTRQEVEEEKR